MGFAPKGSYRLGEHTSESLAKDGLVIITYDKRQLGGAEKIGRLLTKFKHILGILGVKVQEGQAPQKRVSGLDDFYGDGLLVNGDGDFFDDDGCASGVWK